MLSFNVEINTQDKAYNLKKAPFTKKRSDKSSNDENKVQKKK